jgi:GNAT superfamily N-acetyltransferase
MQTIRRAVDTDIPDMVAIAAAKRIEYQGYSPVFWRKAPDASSRQEHYFQALLHDPNLIALIAAGEETLAGFVIGALTTAPPIYNSGGPVCLIDDFAVADPTHWPTIGAALFEAMQREAKGRGAVLIVVVCAQRDEAKRTLLRAVGLSVASEWHVGLL